MDCIDNLVGNSVFSGSSSGRWVGPVGSHRPGRMGGVTVGHLRLRIISGGGGVATAELPQAIPKGDTADVLGLDL